MTPELLRQLIAAGETLNVEFKGEADKSLNDRDLAEAVVCLANRPADGPGWLLVGVEDDGKVTGAKPRHADRIDPLRIQALISGRTRPSVTVRATIVPLDGKDVLAIEVPPVRSPVGTSDGRYLRRTIAADGKPECLPFHFHEMQGVQADRGLLDYTALALPDAKWSDLDPLEFERFRRFIRENRTRGDEGLGTLPDKELAKALGAVEANHEVRSVRVLGLLLFGKEEALRSMLPSHEVAFQVLAGTRVEVNDFFRGPLLRVFEELLSRFRARNKEQELVEDLLRIGIPDYPERAFREAVANSLVHRDYTRIGAVHVQWHQDRIEISNPGGFPEGVRLDNLLVTPPRPRNPLLADALKRAGVVERTARGIDTIFEEQLRNGRPAPSYDRSTDASVVLQLPGGPAATTFVKVVVEEARAQRPLRVDDLLVLHALREERSISVARASELIQKPPPEARAVLERLVEVGHIEGRGNASARSFHLSGRMYERFGDTAAYVRQKGFEPIQQEEMVLAYVRKKGQITRREAAQLCKIASAQARYLLTKLAEKGQLVLHGKKRTAFYGLSSNTLDAAKHPLDVSKTAKRTSKRRTRS